MSNMHELDDQTDGEPAGANSRCGAAPLSTPPRTPFWRRRKWSLLVLMAVVAVLATCALAGAGPPPAKNDPPEPLPKPIIEAWKKLEIPESTKTDLGLRHYLAAIEPPTTLTLGGWEWKVTDAGLKELARTKSLQTLSFTGTQLTGANLKALAGLKNLQDLNLSGTQVTDEGLQELAGLKSLRWLYLVDTQVTDVGLKHLLGLKNLQTLQLEGTSVTDEGLKVLAGLKSLQDLNVIATNVTDAGPKELQKALPDIVISY